MKKVFWDIIQFLLLLKYKQINVMLVYTPEFRFPYQDIRYCVLKSITYILPSTYLYRLCFI